MTTPPNTIAGLLETVDLSAFETEATGFFPYWNPSTLCTKCGLELGDNELRCRMHPDAAITGNAFYGQVFVRDDADPQFVRYHIMAKARMRCFRGDVEHQEEVIIEPGEFFTVGEYASLPLARYMGFAVYVETKSKRKLPGNEASQGKPRTLLEFTLRVDKTTKQLLQSKRDEYATKLRELAMTRISEVKPRLNGRPMPNISAEEHDAAEPQF